MVGGVTMQDIDIHFRQIEDNEFWLIYNQESYIINTYNDGKFHNKLYECEKKHPNEDLYEKICEIRKYFML